MKVLGVYDKNSHLVSFGKDVFKTTEKYLKKFPSEYSKCYYDNLETVEILRGSKFENGNLEGLYYDLANKIMYLHSEALSHEIFHMASNDMENNQYAFESGLQIESGLIEGMTEYSRMKAYGLSEPKAYEFETFVVSMLEHVPNIFRPYFIPSSSDFINLFANKKDIYSILYALDYYNECIMYLYSQGDTDDFDAKLLKENIKIIIDSLINIELSLPMENRTAGYGDKFLDLITSECVSDILMDVYPKYDKYAHKQINKRVRKLG